MENQDLSQDQSQSQVQKLNLFDLDDDSIASILFKLGLTDLKSTTLTNKKIRNIVKENQIFQKNFTQLDRFVEKIDLRGWIKLQFEDVYKDRYFNLKISGNELICNDSSSYYFDHKIILPENYGIYK